MTQLVQISTETDYSLITIDDGKANALSFDLLEQLNGALIEAEQAGKVVIVAGRPGKFSAGFDLKVMGQGGEAMRDLLLAGARTSRRLLEFPTPVILAASGHALAMGALLLLSADYRIGVHGNYKIGLNEVAIGMTLPYFGVALAEARLAKRHINNAVGLAHLYDGDGAVQAGFLDEVVNESDLLAAATAQAERLSQIDMNAHRQTKARVRAALYPKLQEAMAKELGGD
jgi:enoyl-CoA hydratase